MTNKIDRDNPVSFNQPGRQMLEDVDVSQVGMALLTLTKELWVLSDRVRILEAVLEDKGLDVHEEVERFQPNAALQQELDDAGEALVEKVLDALQSSS